MLPGTVARDGGKSWRCGRFHDRRSEGLILSIYESLIVTAPASSHMREKWGPPAYPILTLSIRLYFNAFS